MLANKTRECVFYFMPVFHPEVVEYREQNRLIFTENTAARKRQQATEGRLGEDGEGF